MAIQKINKDSSVALPVSACSPVTLCLNSAWSNRTVSGLTTIRATISNSFRLLGSSSRFGKVLGLRSRNSEVIQYTLEVDDSQFLINGGTGLPFVLTCDDILEINPYDCTTQALEEAVQWSQNLFAEPNAIDDVSEWATFNMVVVGDNADTVDGLPTADFLGQDNTTNFHYMNDTPSGGFSSVAGRQYKFGLDLELAAGTGKYVKIEYRGGSWQVVFPAAHFHIDGAGTLVGISGIEVDYATIVQLDATWYRIELVATSSITSSFNTSFKFADNSGSGAENFLGDGVSGFNVANFSLQYRL